MTITNGYATQGQLKSVLNITDSNDDIRIDAAINAASRQIDAHTGRRFWQDSAVVDRQYYADSFRCLYTDDISTTTGLVVKIDDDDDGTFETTLTISTHFLVLPLNAADETPVRPYTEILLTDDTSAWFPRSNSGRPGVQITAKFGWPAVPDDVTQACIIQAKNLYKATSGTYSGFQLSVEAGVAMRVPGMDWAAAALLESYRKVAV